MVVTGLARQKQSKEGKAHEGTEEDDKELRHGFVLLFGTQLFMWAGS